MTTMKRVSISLPDDLDRRILDLRRTDQFVRSSYSEIVRQLLERGFAALAMPEPEQLQDSA